MTFAELKSRIIVDRLGYDLNNTEMVTTVEREINSIIMEDLPARGIKPFILNTDLTTIANNEKVDLPTNYSSIKLVRKLEDDGSYTDLTPMDWQDMEITDTGDIHKYMILPSTDRWQMYFRYIPDDVYTVNIFYEAKETELVNDTDEPLITILFGAEIVVSGVMYRMADIRRFPDNVLLRWKANYERQITNVIYTQSKFRGVVKDSGVRYNLYS